VATCDLDVELLISELSASLTPPRHAAFEATSRTALAMARPAKSMDADSTTAAVSSG
jgi:hypothetical protein